MGRCVVHEFSVGFPSRFKFQIGKLVFYPLLPMGGFVHLTPSYEVSRLRRGLFTINGCVFSVLASILCVYIGMYLIPAEVIAQLPENHKLKFLIDGIFLGRHSYQVAVATALILSGGIQGLAHATNILPFKNYDGEGLLRVIQNKPDKERYVGWRVGT